MKRNYTLNAFYVVCVVIVLLAYPVKNYSAIVNRTAPVESVERVEKPVAEQSTEILHSDLLFK
jgi:Na+-transporting methylmalonyl-CoA/oxaloacetate decarboxylase gamma subunit